MHSLVTGTDFILAGKFIQGSAVGKEIQAP